MLCGDAGDWSEEFICILQVLLALVGKFSSLNSLGDYSFTRLYQQPFSWMRWRTSGVQVV